MTEKRSQEPSSIENKKAVPCVNGKIWENTYERVWPLEFSPDDRLVACISKL